MKRASSNTFPSRPLSRTSLIMPRKLLVNMRMGYKQGLEKIISPAKKHWKGIVTAIALPFVFNSNARAGGLFLKIYSSLMNPKMYIKHINGATEDYGTYDSLFLEAWSPTIDFYSKTSLNPPADKLMKDSRPPESMSTITSEIVGVGLPSPVTDAQLDPLIWYPSGENNFSWENIIGELYNNEDINDSNNLLGVYDMKHMDRIDAKIPLTINNGLSYQLLVKFYNHCDFNRDRRIDGLDFDILNDNWGRNNETDPNTFGSYVGSDVNDVNAYADINRSGGVDFDDLDIFKTYFRFRADISLDGAVRLDDFAKIACDWGATDANSISDISGPDGDPDRNVNFYDLEAFARDYVRDINDPATW